MDRFREGYILAFVLGFIPFIWLLFTSGWDFGTLLNSEFMLGVFTVSGTTMKFLSGIGIMLTYATFCTLIFKVTSDAMKKNASRAKTIKYFLVLPLFGILIYGMYKIAVAFLFNETLGFIEILISLYGVWSLMISVYILPAARGQYRPEHSSSTKDEILKKVDDVGFSLWRGYQTRLRGDFGKAYSKEFERYGTRLDKVRAQLSGILLLPLGLVLTVFPPLAAVLVVLWIRSFSLKGEPLKMFERVLLILVVVGVLILSSYVFLVLSIPLAVTFFDLAYGIGIILSVLLLIFIILGS